MALTSVIRAHRSVLLCLLAVGVSRASTAAAQQETLPPHVMAGIDSLFEQYDRPWSPGCAVGVIRNGALVLQRAYGMANLEHGIVIDDQTIFRLGSVSKEFTAAAVALLVADKQLALDEDIRTYLPDFPGYGDPVTLSQLLHHTSGIRDYGGLMFLAGAKPDATYDGDDVYRMLVRQRGLDVRPGSAFGYSNSNYYLLARIIETVTGQPFDRVLRERLFEPLGMRSTNVQQNHTHLVRRRATGYALVSEPERYRLNDTWIDVVGAANVMTTIADMARWERNLDDPVVGGVAMRELLLRPGRLANGDSVNYGAGFQLGAYRGLPFQGHAGAFAGYRADHVRFPQARVSVVTLCNVASATPWTAGRRVAELILSAKMLPASPTGTAPRAQSPQPVRRLLTARAAAYAGRYRSDELGVEYAIEYRGDSLVVVLPQPITVTLSPSDTADMLVAPFGPGILRLRFARDRTGRVVGFALEAMRLSGITFHRVSDS
jgi:CubicO group peptidase (beta-lactamase class C family)